MKTKHLLPSIIIPLLLLFLYLLGLGSLKETSYFVPAQQFFDKNIKIYFYITFIFFLIANFSYLLILILGYINAKRKYCEKLLKIDEHLTSLKSLKPISLIIPCYNEEMTIVDSLNSMLRLDYPEFELIVCNDGSKDKTLKILIDQFDLKKIEVSFPKTLPSKEILDIYHSRTHQNLYVIDKENGGKADALNASINLSQYPLICCVDSDSIVDSKGLLNVAMPFIESDDVIATGGTILTANTSGTLDKTKLTQVNTDVPFSWYGMIQSIEYLRAFMVGRLGWDLLRCDAIISGAFGLFKKSLVIKVGGYATKTIGEDMELILRMQSHCKQNKIKYIVSLLPVPVCWTEPPGDLTTLANQRIRWSQGLIESLWTHKNMFFKPWAGTLGTIGLPYYLFFEVLAAPIEIIGYYIVITGIGLEVFQWPAIGLMMLITIIFGCILNLGAVVIDQLTFNKYKKNKDILFLVLGAILEHFGFRQLHLYWRLKGIFRWILNKQSWGEMKRSGLEKDK